MACSICGHDGPFVPSPDDADIVTCIRCRVAVESTATRRVRHRVDARHGGIDDIGKATAGPPPIVADDDDWDDMYRPTESWTHDRANLDKKYLRVDTASRPVPSASTEGRRVRSHWLQWIILSLGATLFSCGAALIAWSFGEDRQDLWNLGAPMALAGQAAFLIGLVLQLDVIWQQSKQTRRRLEDLDHRVSPLTGSVVGSPSTSKSMTRLAEKSDHDTDSLLRELKIQLDRVATRIRRSQR